MKDEKYKKSVKQQEKRILCIKAKQQIMLLVLQENELTFMQ